MSLGNVERCIIVAMTIHLTNRSDTFLTMDSPYRKHFIPLESDPEIFNKLIYSLGASPSLAFEDVVSLDELTALPHPALALILIFPTTQDYEKQKAGANKTYSIGSSGVVWFKQTINNACGLYAILHSLGNNISRSGLRRYHICWDTIFVNKL